MSETEDKLKTVGDGLQNCGCLVMSLIAGVIGIAFIAAVLFGC